MIIKNFIKECKVSQGDLVFIFHKTKPYKSGWWRKIREGSSENNKIYYILEKPMHKGFNIDIASVNSHSEKGLCVMTDKTLKSGIEYNKYEIMADVRGVDCVLLSANNYNLTNLINSNTDYIDENRDNIVITERFKSLLQLYNPQKTKVSDIEVLAGDLI